MGGFIVSKVIEKNADDQEMKIYGLPFSINWNNAKNFRSGEWTVFNGSGNLQIIGGCGEVGDLNEKVRAINLLL